jgi:cell division protein FtsL
MLLAGVLLSGVGVVYAKYLSRKYFVELELLRTQWEQNEIEWGRLQLEQSTLATHGRVEKTARRRLDMHIPAPQEVIVIKP